MLSHNTGFSRGNGNAIVALLKDKTALVWGNARRGGAPNDWNIDRGSYFRGIPNDLSDIVDIFSNEVSFAALTSVGKVLTWGRSEFGGCDTNNDPSPYSGTSFQCRDADLSDVIKMSSTNSAYAAIQKNGQVSAWVRD